MQTGFQLSRRSNEDGGLDLQQLKHATGGDIMLEILDT